MKRDENWTRPIGSAVAALFALALAPACGVDGGTADADSGAVDSGVPDGNGGPRPRVLDGPLARNPQNPVVANGPEPFDVVKAGPRSVVVMGPGDYRMWYEAIGEGGLLPTAVGYATSSDGSTWEKQGIVMAASEAWEGPEVSSTSVMWDDQDGVFKMWFHGGGNEMQRHIGYATSPDGITWTKAPGNPILDPGPSGAWDDGFVADCKVIKVASGDYRMWYRGTSADGITQIGYATSADGTAWTKHPANPVFRADPAGWDKESVIGPAVFRDQAGGRFHMWYSGVAGGGSPAGVGLGYAYSDDGIAWTRGAGNPVLVPNPSPDAPDADLGDTLDAYVDGDRIRVLYGCFNFTGAPVRAICEATLFLTD